MAATGAPVGYRPMPADLTRARRTVARHTSPARYARPSGRPDVTCASGHGAYRVAYDISVSDPNDMTAWSPTILSGRSAQDRSARSSWSGPRRPDRNVMTPGSGRG